MDAPIITMTGYTRWTYTVHLWLLVNRSIAVFIRMHRYITSARPLSKLLDCPRCFW